MTADDRVPLGTADAGAGERRISPDKLRALLAAATYLPVAWVIGLVAVAIATMLDVTVEKGDVRWHLSVGTISLVALSLIWLPTALRLMSLTGGSVRGAGVEASTGGILSSDDLIKSLVDVRAAADLAGQGAIGTDSLVESVGATVDQIAQSYLPETALSNDVLAGLARRYEDIRRTQSPGRDRTIAMNRLINEVRIRANAAPEAAQQRAHSLMRSDRDGDRIVGLGLVEGSPDAERLDDILRIFASSRSAFEQYHSLLALDAIADSLGPDDRAKATRVLQREKSDPRNIGLMTDPYIPSWIDKVLASLRA